MRWFIDGNNVMGSRADGWWNDPASAKARLARSVALWCRTHSDEVLLVFDRPEAPQALVEAGGNLSVEFAAWRSRDAADRHIVNRVEEAYVNDVDLTVVTADRGLIDRLPPGVATLGPGRFLSQL
jgi:predicted RNA-binding protein with PIN domain